MKTVYLVRHGQTLFNVQHKIQGFCDSPLTELGIKQALTTKKEYFDCNQITLEEAHCSTSERAFGGESQVELTKRINKTITEIVTESSHEQILIVSHGAAIANFYRQWEKYNTFTRKDRIKNCSVLKYTFKNDVFYLQELFNPSC